MTIFANETIGSHDAKTAEYVSVWFDESRVTGFKFHDVGMHDAAGNYSRVHGISVDARFVWTACTAFHSAPSKAIAPDGHTFYVTRVWLSDGITEEFRAGDKYGAPIARMVRTGYVQQAVAA